MSSGSESEPIASALHSSILNSSYNGKEVVRSNLHLEDSKLKYSFQSQTKRGHSLKKNVIINDTEENKVFNESIERSKYISRTNLSSISRETANSDELYNILGQAPIFSGITSSSQELSCEIKQKISHGDKLLSFNTESKKSDSQVSERRTTSKRRPGTLGIGGSAIRVSRDGMSTSLHERENANVLTLESILGTSFNIGKMESNSNIIKNHPNTRKQLEVCNEPNKLPISTPKNRKPYVDSLPATPELPVLSSTPFVPSTKGYNDQNNNEDKTSKYRNDYISSQLCAQSSLTGKVLDSESVADTINSSISTNKSSVNASGSSNASIFSPLAELNSFQLLSKNTSNKEVLKEEKRGSVSSQESAFKNQMKYPNNHLENTSDLKGKESDNSVEMSLNSGPREFDSTAERAVGGQKRRSDNHTTKAFQGQRRGSNDSSEISYHGNRRESGDFVKGNYGDYVRESKNRHPSFMTLLSNDKVIEVNGHPYFCLGCIGKGGSSQVYRVLSTDSRILALKQVNVAREDSAGLESYANEIALLKRLRGDPSIIELEESEVDSERGSISLVLELGETDLAQLLTRQREANSRIGTSPHFIRITWLQMLQAVSALHAQRVVHGDLKPANFVLCRGVLKLIDFGIAKAIGTDTTNIQRDSHVGTVNYMSPEALVDTGKGAMDPSTGKQSALMKLGRASDVWSLGCILYQLVYGRTPFSNFRSFVHKFRAILDESYEVPYDKIDDSDLLDTMKRCLCRDPTSRAPIDGHQGLLDHPYLVLKKKQQQGLSKSAVRAIVEQTLNVTGNPDVRPIDEICNQVVRNLQGRSR